VKALPKILLALTAVAALSVAYPAKANTITTFNVSGTCTPLAPFTGTTFGGTLTIDVTAGTVTAIDVSFQGLSPFNTILLSQPFGTSDWVVTAGNGVSQTSHVLFLDFTTGHTPGSLVGFTGGTIFQGEVADALLQEDAYFPLNGSITAPASVPDEGSSLTLLGIALPCLLGFLLVRRNDLLPA
jgi:hypothetical protein